MDDTDKGTMLKITVKSELLPLVLLAILLIVTIIISLSDSNILRIILGLPLVLFFPGYTLMAALFPRRGRIGNIERLALGFGLSLAIVPIMGLILNSTEWGIRLDSILWFMTSFTFITLAIAWFRRKKLPDEERFSVIAPINLRIGIRNKVLSIVLVIAVLGALGMVGYAIVTPKVGQQFTEFYILGAEGEAVNYPESLELGEAGIVTVGIINREYETISYHVEVVLNDMKVDEIGPLMLQNDEKWSQVVSFTPGTVGEKQKVEFLLYKAGEVEPYIDPLHLWLDVID